MRRLFEKAKLLDMVEWQRDPMELVEVKGISNRRKKPIVLTSFTNSLSCWGNPAGRRSWWHSRPASGPKRCWRSNDRTSTSRTLA
jgi:hypothetical protein